MRKKLLVISEVNIVRELKGTRNNALDLIVNEYSPFFEEIHYLGPTNDKITEPFKNGNVTFHPVVGYSKKITDRLRFVLFFPFYKKKIKAVIKRIQPDVIQLRIPAVFSVKVYSAVKKLNIPVTTYVAGEWDDSFHANYKNRITFSKQLGRYLHAKQFKVVKNTIPVTTGSVLKERLAGINDCYSYYSTTHKTVHRRDNITHPAYRILTIGRIENAKRHEDAILALEKLVKVSRDYTLTIMGDGILRSHIEELVRQLSLEEHVNFLGHVYDQQTKEEILISHEILLHPSISEGTPKVLPEAMSFGLLPIAIRDVGSNNDIIKNGVNGYLLNRENPQEIFDTIINYNNMEKEAVEKIIENGYKYAEEHTIGAELKKMWQYVFERIDNR